MPTFHMPRESYIPKKSAKVSDKQSDAVAYVYTTGKGRPAAAIFVGKQAKPVAHYTFRSQSEMERTITEQFISRRSHQNYIATKRAEDKSAGVGLVVGDILNTHWGYDQTNIEFFEVTEVRGKHVILREICSESVSTGDMTGRAVPQSGAFKGEPIRRLARNGNVSIDSVRGAWKWNTATVAGVPVGPAKSWSSYA